MRISDWSSDVCSSDLSTPKGLRDLMNIADIKPYTGSVQYKVDVGGGFLQKFLDEQAVEEGIDLDPDFKRGHVWTPQNQTRYLEHLLRGGPSRYRKSVVSGQGVAVRVGFGGSGIM